MTGCGTQSDQAEVESLAEVEAQARADAEADALALAETACNLWHNTPRSDIYEERYAEERDLAQEAAAVASTAAYLDPRWRTLADAFPYIARWKVLQLYEETLGPDEELLPFAEREKTGLARYERAVGAECDSVLELVDGPPYFPELTDTE